jgi:hypothetical protein
MKRQWSDQTEVEICGASRGIRYGSLTAESRRLD